MAWPVLIWSGALALRAWAEEVSLYQCVHDACEVRTRPSHMLGGNYSFLFRTRRSIFISKFKLNFTKNSFNNNNFLSKSRRNFWRWQFAKFLINGGAWGGGGWWRRLLGCVMFSGWLAVNTHLSGLVLWMLLLIIAPRGREFNIDSPLFWLWGYVALILEF